MKQYVAFLRAINVTNRYVKMPILRQPFIDLGFTHVDTYIQSGNVLFATEKQTSAIQLESLIESTLQEALGFAVPTMLRTYDEVKNLPERVPFSPSPEDTVYVSFLKTTPTPEQCAKLYGYNSEIDTFQILGQELFWLYKRPLGKSKLTNSRIEKILKVQATNRNLTSIQKLITGYLQ